MLHTNHQQLARIAAPENLLRAWNRIRAKKASGGIDGEGVPDFAAHAELELEKLREELLTGTYIPKPLLQAELPKPNKPGEKRPIALPAIRDKIAQEATRHIIEPLIDPHFLDNSYGYRFGKGPQKAVKRVIHILKQLKMEWVVSLDIDEFFPSIDHDVLVDMLRVIGIEEPICRLLLLCLKMGLVNSDNRWVDVYHGLSQGGIISPLLANLYLHSLDVRLREWHVEFVRYADDIRLFLDSRRQAENILSKTQCFLQEELKLKLNPFPESVTAVRDGFTFMGIRFVPEGLLIDPEKWPVFEDKIRHILFSPKFKDWDKRLAKLNESVAGWKNYYGSLVDPGEMIRFQEQFKSVLIKRIAAVFALNKEKDNIGQEDDLRKSLAFIELPACNNTTQREEFIKTLFEQAKEDAAKRLEKKQTLQNIQKLVRKEKRRHLRQVSHVAHLVINNPGYFLGKNGERMVIREKRKTLYEIFLNRLESITLLSKATSISSDLVTHCAKIGIPLCWITSKGEVEAIILSPDSSTGELQIRQLEAARDPRQAFVLAKSFVVGKIKNQVHLIKYFGKYEKHRNGTFMDTYHRFENDTEKILTEAYDLEPSDDWPHTRGQLFSIEGRLASYYWDMFRLLLEGLVDFPGRERQGARDLVNCLLNYGYAVLRSRVLLELHRSGLNPYISFLHAGQKGIATLTFDVMEVFRPQVVDRVVLAELRKNSKRFKLDEEGRLIPESREHLVRQILDRLASIEKFRGRELKLEEIIREQVADLKKHFENKALYRPYMAKW